MSLHNKIMNLAPGPEMPEDNPGRGVYKVGHRDARHAAAELANEADTLIEDLAAALQMYVSAGHGASTDPVKQDDARQAGLYALDAVKTYTNSER